MARRELRGDQWQRIKDFLPGKKSDAGRTARNNRIIQRLCDFALSREGNLIERFFNKIKHYRAIATRYAKRARNCMAFVARASAVMWIK